jgi:hypothetical protein
MKFYTNVHLYRNEILLRGYENGQRIKQSIEYQPYLFEPNPVYESKGIETPYRTLKGQKVYKHEFDTIREARDYVKQFEGVRGKDLYGLNSFQYTFINDMYPGDIDYDPKAISIVKLDIETSTE